jgi:hypothetical protein
MYKNLTRKILKKIHCQSTLKKRGVMCRLDLFETTQAAAVGRGKHGNKHSYFITRQ